MKERNLEYEKKFRAYLFKGNWDRHCEVCKNMNVIPNSLSNREKLGLE